MKRVYVVVIVLFVILAAFGCRRRRAVEGSSVTIGAPGGEVAAGQCQATLAVAQVVAPAGCTIDQRVSGQTAVVSYPCEGGPAQAAFGESVFTGSVVGGQVDLAIETAFQFTDGCTWRSKQRISGALGSGSLAYTYEEQPEPGQSGCSNGCTANATVQAY